MDTTSAFEIDGMDAWYGANQALREVSLGIAEQRITAIIGPSGCGKSTFIRCLNRINDLVPGFRVSGSMKFKGQDIYGAGIDPIGIRLRIGMVFQKPNPFPKSIYENVAYGPRLCGIKDRGQLDALVEASLKQAAIWDEVKDKLRHMAWALSGGQQQRLCIARALAVNPEVLLLDEPTSALDPIATAKIEELLVDLKKTYTMVIVTHNMQQAARISDSTAFFMLGKVVEYGPTSRIFTNPQQKLTEDYVTGRFG